MVVVELTLALFVTRVFADDSDSTLSLDDAAGFAELLDGRTDFHGRFLLLDSSNFDFGSKPR